MSLVVRRKGEVCTVFMKRLIRIKRAEKLIDPDGFIEKRASEKHQERAEKMKIDPAGFRETESAGQKQ